MAAATLNVNATLKCPHSGSVTIASANQQVKAESASIALATDVFTIAGCPFQIPVGVGTVPSPCLTVQWQLTDMRVKVGGNATLSNNSVGFCLNAQQVPQGPVVISNPQQKVQSQ
jgi:hypothetical protein